MAVFGLWLPADAAPRAQQYVTPTPGADGRIMYVVQPGDNCFRVAALHGITVDQLRQLNSKLDENCTLIEGQELLIGVVAPATATAPVNLIQGTPTVTPTPTDTATPVEPNAAAIDAAPVPVLVPALMAGPILEKVFSLMT